MMMMEVDVGKHEGGESAAANKRIFIYDDDECKFAMPHNDDGTVELKIEMKHVVLVVCDCE